MQTEPAAATRYTATYSGRPDQVHRVRLAVARHLVGCPAVGDAVLIVSEFFFPMRSSTRPAGARSLLSAPNCTRITYGSRRRTSAARGVAGRPMAARTAWTWSKPSLARMARAWEAPLAAAG